MKKILIGTFVFALLLLTVSSASAKVFKGSASDPNNLWLGEIEYLGTPAGYHFWFTPTSDGAWYEAGHSYHNVYQLEVDDIEGWCGMATVPDREPYNQVGHTGESVYYKIVDTTSGGNICP